jgi:hypothetical protein
VVHILFSPVRGGRAGPSGILLIFLDGSVCNFCSAVSCTRRGEFWSGHEEELEDRRIREADGTTCVRFPRFDFQAGFYAAFHFILEHLRNSILNFRDRFSGAAAARELTTWNLIHRAGLAPLERAPRPSSSRMGFSLSVFRSA